jgi:uncharacterized protein (TIGR04255 family)
LTYPAEFYAKVKQQFPIKETKKMPPSFAINIAPQGSIGVTTEQNQRYILQAWNDSRSQVVQIADNLLSISFLKPYSEWPIFKKAIIDCLEYYKEVVQPNSIDRVVLKYINKIDVGAKHSYESLKEIFVFLPLVPQEIGDANSLQVLMEIPHREGKDILVIQQATLVSETNMQSPILFDISYLLVNNTDFQLDSFQDWLENAHEQIEKTFDLSLTESFKQKIIGGSGKVCICFLND